MSTLIAMLMATLKAQTPSPWQSYSLPGPAHWRGAAYGGTTFVAVANDEGSALTSTDAINWTAHSVGGGYPPIASIFFGNGLFIATYLGSAHFLGSADGKTWAEGQLVLNGTTVEDWTCGAYGNGTYVALAGNSGTGVYSTVGTAQNWHYSNLPTVSNWSAVTYGAKFVGIASGSNAAATSPDGITWTAATLPASASWTSIAYGASTYVAVASGGTVAATSPDGTTWTARTLPASATWQSVAYGAGLFVAVGGTASCATSPDGTTWTTRTLPTSRAWRFVAFLNGQFLALSDDDDVSATSPDGVNWTVRSIRMPHRWSGIAWGGGKFVAVAADGGMTASSSGAALAAVSSDGKTWTRSTLTRATTVWNTVTYGNGNFVAASSGATITDTVVAVSPDGITWTEHALPVFANWAHAAYGNSVFMLAANGANSVLTSPDGITWTSNAGPSWSNGLFTDLTFADGVFKLLADNSANPTSYQNIITTANGTAWSADTQQPGSPPTFTYLAHNSWRFATEGEYLDFGASAWRASAGSPTGLMAYGGGSFFAFAEGTVNTPDSTVETSIDGNAWSSSALPRANIWSDAAWGNGALVVLGYPDNQVLYRALPGVPFSLGGTLPNTTVGSAYSGTLTLGGDFTWPVTISGLATWMSYSIQGSVVTVTGTAPATGQTDALTVTATDSTTPTALTATSSQSVVVGGTPMTLTGTLAGSAQVGVAYSSTLTLGGAFTAPVTISAASGAIPAWMTVSVSGTTVTFSGTPTASGTVSFTPKATDSTTPTAQTATGPAQSINVAANPMTLTGTLPGATAGTAYSATLTLGGAFTAPVTIDASAGVIPAWMSHSVSGTTVTFSGTPAAGDVGTDTFTVRATDSSTPTAQVATDAQSVVVSAAGSAPVLVQQASGPGNQATGTTITVSLAAAPTSGNTLLLAFYGVNSSDATITLTGWTLVGTTGAGSGVVGWYKKVSDGSEQNTTVTFGASNAIHNAAIQEWKGTPTLGTLTGGLASYASGSATLGPTDAPPASAVPAMFASFTAASPASLTWSSGWTASVIQTGGTQYPYHGDSIGYGPSSTAAVSPVLTSTRGSSVAWTNLWLS